MKRITKIFMVAAAGILMFAGCKRGEQVAPLNTIYATVASHNGVNPSGGKSQIDGNDVKWSEDDKIALITSGGEIIEYTLSSGSGTTSGTFTGANPKTETGPYCVVYPYSSVTGSSFSDDGVFTVYDTLPREQSYSKNSFGEGANLSIGYSNDYNFKFLNMMGVLKVTINNDTTCFVEKVELVSRNPDDKLWGNGKVTISGSTADSLNVELTGGSNVLTLGRCMKWEAGDVSLYFVVPAGTLQSGFEIKIYEYGYANPITKDANEEAIEFTNPNGQNVIQRNMVSVLDFGDRLIPTKGYVDLGEAGKWAQCNYGADKPYEPGGYYQFGGKKNVFGLGEDGGDTLKKVCPYLETPLKIKPINWTWEKYDGEDGCETLCSDDDVVASGIGKDWCIPDDSELKKVTEKCTFTRYIVNGVEGVLVENEASGNYMFLPACGYWGWAGTPGKDNPGHINSGSVYIGSKTVKSSSAYSVFAALTFFTNDGKTFKFLNSTFYRVFGVQIRPVYVGPN